MTGYDDGQPRMGFFTDTSVCIGCKACEVACKEWNGVPENPFAWTGESYDNTSGLGANSWRHVAFIEQGGGQFAAGSGESTSAGHSASAGQSAGQAEDFRWLMSSDVCKHCTTAACLDVCPTGALFKTEFETVVVQEDVCNGCGYCVPACPYGVIDRREEDGRAWKCTLCYDRLKVGEEPACAKACPTDSINFGTLEAMTAMAADRLDVVVAAGRAGAQLYGDGPSGGVDGTGSVFLLLDDPEVYGLPPDPIATSKDLPSMWGAAAAAAVTLVGAVVAAFVG
ncbi:MAG: 4Fe-4S dicluster domain-containing protein, partial [Actinomycetota bacterium]|nr:4Fe-4S dicluster domain-containing protein [Actinomycetota bacterium]